jgi:hypothetical protein
MRTYEHTAFAVLGRYDMFYGGHKRRRRRFRASASIFRLIWISLLPNVVERDRNRTARFHCVFSSTGGYGFSKNSVRLGSVTKGSFPGGETPGV